MLRDMGSGLTSRVSARILSTAAQVANARLFTLRNTGSNLIVIKSLLLKALQVAAGTAQENSLDVYKLTGFTVSDTVNTVTPVPSVSRTTTAFVSGAALRHLTVAGQVNGMTGGTLTKDGSPIAQLPYNVAAAINVASMPQLECFPDLSGGGEPLFLAQNEGLLIENRVLNVTSFGMAWFLDISFSEVTA